MKKLYDAILPSVNQLASITTVVNRNVCILPAVFQICDHHRRHHRHHISPELTSKHAKK